MLTCHPQIVIPPEAHIFLWLEVKYGDINPLKDDLELFYQDVLGSRKFETWGISKGDIKSAVALYSPKDYGELMGCIYLMYGLKRGKRDVKYWGDKNKLWKEKLNDIPRYFPRARFIHLVRDGRDVACSFIELSKKEHSSPYAPRLPVEIDEIAERWKLNVGSIESFLTKINVSHKLTICYEDLVRKPKTTLNEIMAFLNLSYHDNMLSYRSSEMQALAEPDSFKSWKDKLNQLPDASNVGKYINELDREQINIFEEIASDQLSRFGYLQPDE